ADPDCMCFPRSTRTFTRCLLCGINPGLLMLPTDELFDDEEAAPVTWPTKETWQSLLHRVRDALQPMNPKSPNRGTGLPPSGPLGVFHNGFLVPAQPVPGPILDGKTVPMYPADADVPPGYPWGVFPVSRITWSGSFPSSNIGCWSVGNQVVGPEEGVL